MKKISWKLFTFLFFPLYFLTQMNAFAANVDKIIVFGDSLSDTGNLYSLSNAAHQKISLVPVIPKSPPYYQGMFSNGPVWIKLLADTLNVEMNNYAYGGAWAERIFYSKLPIPSFIAQVNYYMVRDALDFHKENHLYVIWIGSNDYMYNRFSAERATTRVITMIEKQLKKLIAAGATKFLILNLPDLGLAPQNTAKGKEFSEALTHLAELHNRKMSEMLTKVQQQHQDAKLVSLDVMTQFKDIIAHPNQYGLKNVTDACYGGKYTLQQTMNQDDELHVAIENNPSLNAAFTTQELPVDSICSNPDDYLFWDKLHPTRVAHQLIAIGAMNALLEGGVS